MGNPLTGFRQAQQQQGLLAAALSTIPRPDTAGMHALAQGFDMSEIDSDLLYRHHLMSQQQQQQQPPPPLNGIPQPLPHAQQQQQQLPGMHSVKSEGNMEDLLSLFLRVRNGPTCFCILVCRRKPKELPA